MPAAPFDGLVNFRDLGDTPVAGGRIRPGRLLRSDSLGFATAADADRLVRDFGVRTIVDLREASEVAAFGRGPLERADIGYMHVPIGDVKAKVSRPDMYVRMAAESGSGIARLILGIGQGAVAPVVIHCHIGVDRTGIVMALILGLIGASDDVICADYAASALAAIPLRDRARARRRALGLPAMPDSYYDASTPRPEIMAETLSRLGCEWGGFVGWASAHDLSHDDITALRGVFVVEV